jgi:hypothetical protein
MKVNVIDLNSLNTQSVQANIKMLQDYNSQLVSSDKPLTLFSHPQSSFKPIQTISTKTISHNNLIKWYESLRQDEHWSSLRKELDDAHSSLFIRWINQHFIRHININDNLSETSKNFYRSLTVRNLFEDLADGLRIIYLLEVIHHVHLSKEIGKNVLHKIKNFQICINFMETERNVTCVGINTYDLVDGNRKILMALLFLIKHDYETTVYKHESLLRQYRIREKIQMIKKQKLEEIQNEIEYEKQRKKRKYSHKSRYSEPKQTQQPQSHQREEPERVIEQQLGNNSQRALRSKSYSGSQADFLPFDNSHGFYLAKHLSNKSIDNNLVDQVLTPANMTSEIYDLVNGLVHTNTKVDELYTAHVKSYTKLNDTGFQSISKQSSSNKFGDSYETNNRFSLDNELSSLKSESFGYSSLAQINSNRLTMDCEQISDDVSVDMANNNYDVGYNSLPSEIDKYEQPMDESNHVKGLKSLIDNDMNIIKSFEMNNVQATPKHSSQIIEFELNDDCLIEENLSKQEEKVDTCPDIRTQNSLSENNCEVCSNENEIENERIELEKQTEILSKHSERSEKTTNEPSLDNDDTNQIVKKDESYSDSNENIKSLIETNLENSSDIQTIQKNPTAVQSTHENPTSNQERLNELNDEMLENVGQPIETKEGGEPGSKSDQERVIHNEIVDSNGKNDGCLENADQESYAELPKKDSQSIDTNLVEKSKNENLISEANFEKEEQCFYEYSSNTKESELEKPIEEENNEPDAHTETSDVDSKSSNLEDKKSINQANENNSIKQASLSEESDDQNQLEEMYDVSVENPNTNDKLINTIDSVISVNVIDVEYINEQESYLLNENQGLENSENFDRILSTEEELSSNETDHFYVDTNKNSNESTSELNECEAGQIELVVENLEETPEEITRCLINDVNEKAALEVVVIKDDYVLLAENENLSHYPNQNSQLNQLISTSTNEENSSYSNDIQTVSEKIECERVEEPLINECPIEHQIEQALTFDEQHMKFIDEPRTDSLTDTYETDTFLKDSSQTDEIETNFKYEIEMYDLLDQQASRVEQDTNESNLIIQNEFKVTVIDQEEVLNDSLLDAQNETFNSEPNPLEFNEKEGDVKLVPPTEYEIRQTDSAGIGNSKINEEIVAPERVPFVNSGEPRQENSGVLNELKIESPVLNTSEQKSEKTRKSNKKTLDITNLSSFNQKHGKESIKTGQKVDEELNELQQKHEPNEQTSSEKQKSSKRMNHKLISSEIVQKENINTNEHQTHQKNTQDFSAIKQQSVPNRDNRDMASNYLKENVMNFQTSLVPNVSSSMPLTNNKTIDSPATTSSDSTKSAAEIKNEKSSSLTTVKRNSPNKKISSKNTSSKLFFDYKPAKWSFFNEFQIFQAI